MALSSFQAWQTSRRQRPNISPSSHLSFSLIAAFVSLSLFCLFFSFVYPLRVPFEFSTGDPTVDLSMSSRASSSQNSSLSLTELTHRHRMSPFAPLQREAEIGQFGKPLSSCGEFPLRETFLSSQTYVMLDMHRFLRELLEKTFIPK